MAMEYIERMTSSPLLKSKPQCHLPQHEWPRNILHFIRPTDANSAVRRMKQTKGRLAHDGHGSLFDTKMRIAQFPQTDESMQEEVNGSGRNVSMTSTKQMNMCLIWPTVLKWNFEWCYVQGGNWNSWISWSRRFNKWHYLPVNFWLKCDKEMQWQTEISEERICGPFLQEWVVKNAIWYPRNKAAPNRLVQKLTWR